jgi:hypothetical protein
MKCFNCGKKCITKYHVQEPGGAIIAVSKVCETESGCGWESHPIKIPEPI